VVVELLTASGLPFETYGVHGKTLRQKLRFTWRILKDYSKVIGRFRPTLIISKSSPYAAILGKRFGVKTCIMNDSEIVGLTNKVVIPLTSFMITPFTFPETGLRKHLKADGLFEESYLHPSVLKPDPNVHSSLGLEKGEPYAVLRFVGWHANHDVGNLGFSLENKVEIAELVAKSMRVFISSEVELPEELAKYHIPTTPNQIHSVLHFASLYVGDSQTMATEAALLGTPAVRFNSFVGPNDMENFKFLQNQALLHNENSFEHVKDRVSLLLSASSKPEWLERRRSYFSSKKDLDEQILELINAKMDQGK
jgi:hypothetical protein